MYWKNHKSSSLRQKSAQIALSHHSQRTSLGDSGSRINTSFDLDISIIEASQRNLSLISTTPIRAKIAERKSKNKLDHAKRHYVARVLLNRALNVRLAIKKMEDIPTTLFKSGKHFTIASSLVKKSKATLEISVLRTLLYNLDEEKELQVTRLKLQQGNNVFVLPTAAENNSNFRDAIVKLNNMVSHNLRAVLKKFAAHRSDCLARQRYLVKFYTNFVQKRKDALLRFKLLPFGQSDSNYGEIHLIKLSSTLQKISQRTLRLKLQAFNSLILRTQVLQIKQRNAAKLIIMCSKLRKEQGFRFWKRVSSSMLAEEQEESRVQQAKLAALRRIVQRNYLKLFKEINKKIFTARRAAARLGCYSRLNQQKSLWRLLNHAKSSK